MPATTLGLGLVDVLPAALLGGGVPAWPQFPPGRTILTHQGRGAAALACAMLGLGPDDEVLMPSWNCGTEVDSVIAAGPRVALYRVDEKGRIDADDLAASVGARMRAVYVVHYFGVPHDLAPVRGLCRERGLLLVEDCALALFSEGVGRDADAAVYSFPKSLPVPDGGALVLRETPSAPPALTSPSAARILKKTLGLVARRRPRAGEEEVDGRPDMPPDYYWNAATARSAMSRTTRGLLARCDAARIVERRRANFARLVERVRALPGATPLFDDLPPGACPLHLPLLVDRRAAWVAELRSRGVAAIAWWAGHHRALPWDEFPEACRLKERVLAVPIHQGLDDAGIDFVADQLAAVAGHRARRSAR